MAKVAIIVGHPRSGTFCDALGTSYRRGAERAGHEVTLLSTASMRFDPILTGAYVELQPLEPDLVHAHEAIMAADHIVIIFPLWLGDMPAILKGFLERVLQPDIIEPARQGRFVKVLAGKSARIIVTMGMPVIVYRLWFGASALRILKRNILGFLGVKPIRSTLHGSVEGVPHSRREVWLAEAERLGARAA